MNKLELNCVTQGHVLEVLRTIPGASVDCVVTSPPYFGLRDYGTDPVAWPEANFTIFGMQVLVPAMVCSYGLEATPEAFVGHAVLIFKEVFRVLKPWGTCWVNFGDSYCGSATGSQGNNLSTLQGGKSTQIEAGKRPGKKANAYLKPKDLIGIPWMVAFALRDAGWYLRQDNIWHKPNPMPESVTDRCTKSHEYIFHLSKRKDYYFDHEAIRTPVTDATVARMMQQIEDQKGSDRVPGKTNGPMKAVGSIRPNGIVRDRLLNYDSKEKQLRPNTKRGGYENEKDVPIPDGMANKKSVWTVTTKPFKKAHFATFPQDLIVDCIKAGTSRVGNCADCGRPYVRVKGGFVASCRPDTNCSTGKIVPAVVMDIHDGAGTTRIVSAKLGCDYRGIELNPEYIKISNERYRDEIGLFAKTTS